MKLSKFFAILGLSTSLVTFSSLSDTADKVMAQCHPLDITCNPHIREHTKKVAEEAWAEAGRGLYQAGAAAIGEDNKRIPLKALTPRQKELLRPEFGSLVDKVRIKYGADMLDRWGSGDFVISQGSAGQTFCDRIYIQAPFNENDDSQLILLAHELEHSRQCEKFGGMSNFGYRYFKEFKKANQNYENNLLEREAREVADRFAQYLASQINSLNLVLDANNGNGDIYLYPKSDRKNLNHLWRIVGVTDGYHMIISKQTGGALDANGGTGNLYLHPKPNKANPNHLWKFLYIDDYTIIGSRLKN